jgi:nucleotide-binding universal stress UspA family protein
MGIVMKFLVGFDGSKSAYAALELAGRYAKALGANITIVASIDINLLTRDSDTKKAEENCLRAQKYLEEENISSETELLCRGFNPGEDIVKYAKDNNAEAVFIGVKNRSKIDKMIFGSNAQYIILNAPCPVITVK